MPARRARGNVEVPLDPADVSTAAPAGIDGRRPRGHLSGVMSGTRRPGGSDPANGGTLSLSRRGLAGTVVLFLAIALFVRLGVWQLDRREERRARNRALVERMDAATLSLDATVRDTAGLRYRMGRAVGEWDGARSIVLPGRSYHGSPGAYVLTPLRLDDGTAVLVNRGWAPAADAATVDSTLFEVRGEAEVEGLLVGFPGHEASLAPRAPLPAAAGQNGFRRVWYAIDEDALRAQFPYRLLPITLQPLAEGGPPGRPVRLDPPALDEGPHFGYAVQWFSFAGIGLVGWLALLLRSRRR